LAARWHTFLKAQGIADSAARVFETTSIELAKELLAEAGIKASKLFCHLHTSRPS